jgi:hypothetical protein
VASAGNIGRNAAGEPVYGGITAPGNAPWVLTVGASSTQGTPTRDDDSIAGFSSRGPTYLDWSAKPDVVAPGVGTISLADPNSTLSTTKAQFLIDGLLPGSQRYLALSGTSMAAPVVSGTVALMLQANPRLTPNAVKAILQYTAEERAGYNALTQGAGFLNAIGAVRLAQFFATAQEGASYPLQPMWSKKIIWGSHRLSGGVLDPAANAFALGATWGVAKTDDGDNIIWGTTCESGCDNIIWGTDGDDNIIWGTDGDDNIIWGTDGEGDNIIWGTDDDVDNIIWGTDCGGDDCDNIIWGTDGDDNIIWGTDGGDNIIWGTTDGDNIIWGNTADDNVTGTAGAADSASTVDSWLLDYYYAVYSPYLSWFTDDQFFQLFDDLSAWLESWSTDTSATTTETATASGIM